ncbi:MAG: hypothetical protein JWO38_2598 [Gemmataceae bacterium]|nr:hypothetical protein [Gemmataceae bacterium]
MPIAPPTAAGGDPKAGIDPAGWPAPTWGRLLAFAAVSRVVVVSAGLAVAPAGPGPHWEPEQVAFSQTVRNGPVPWVEPWYRFDAHWYNRIAREGYQYDPREASTAAFLPLLPACIAAAAWVGLNPLLAGLVIPNVAFVLGLACAGRAALRVTRNHQTVWWGCVFLVTYPFAYFFSAPYQESLFLAASGAALLAWYDRRPATAGAAIMVAATARLTALALPLGLLLESAAGRAWPSRGAWLVVAGAAAGIALFAAYLAVAVGDPGAHFRAHAAWGREPPGLGGVVRSGVAAADALFRPQSPLGAVKPVVLVAVLALGVRGWVRRGPLWGTLILAPVAQALSTGTLLSIERVVLSAYPAAFEAADLPGIKYLRWAWAAAASAAQVFFLWVYTQNGFLT